MPAVATRIRESEAATQVRKNLEADGFTVEYWSVGPGAEVIGLRVAEETVLYVDEGTAEFDVDGRLTRVTDGGRLVVRPGSAFGVRNCGEAGLSWLAASRTAASTRPGDQSQVRRPRSRPTRR